MTALRVQLSDRLTYWTAPHPHWRPNPEWPEQVGCVLYGAPDAVVLIDPLIRDDLDGSAWDWLDRAISAADLPVAVLLTAPWHERSTRDVVDRYAGVVWIDRGARGGVSDLPQLRALPPGISLFRPRGVDEGQVAFFIAPERTLVVADLFLGTGDGLQVCPSPTTRDMNEFARSLRELQRLQPERVLVSHGQPIVQAGGAAIAEALDSFAIA